MHYRNGLEKLLADISVIAEVAQLADEASKIEETEIGDAAFDAMEIRKGLSDTKWHTVTGFAASASSDSQKNQEYVYVESEEIEGQSGVSVERQEDDDDRPTAGCATESESALDAEQQNTTTGSLVGEAGGLQQSLLSSATPTGTPLPPEVAVKDLLDSWEEPVNKLDKASRWKMCYKNIIGRYTNLLIPS